MAPSTPLLPNFHRDSIRSSEGGSGTHVSSGDPEKQSARNKSKRRIPIKSRLVGATSSIRRNSPRLRHKFCRLRYIVTVFFVVILAAVIATGRLFFLSSQEVENFDSGEHLNSAIPPVFNRNTSVNLELYTQITLSSFDSNNGISGIIRFALGQSDIVINSTNQQIPPPNPPIPKVCFIIADKSSGDQQGLTLQGPQQKSAFFNVTTDGLVSRYPFDMYGGGLILLAVYSTNPNTTTNCTDPNASDFGDFQVLQSRIFIGQSLDGFEAAFNGTLWDNSSHPLQQLPVGSVVVTFDVTRATVVQAMAVIMFIATWLICIGIVAATMQVVMYKREPHFELVGASTALLFALPTLRSAQPGIPTVPTVYDTVGYFWNIVLLALCTFALIANSIYLMWAEKRESVAVENDNNKSEPHKESDDPTAVRG